MSGLPLTQAQAFSHLVITSLKETERGGERQAPCSALSHTEGKGTDGRNPNLPGQRPLLPGPLPPGPTSDLFLPWPLSCSLGCGLRQSRDLALGVTDVYFWFDLCSGFLCLRTQISIPSWESRRHLQDFLLPAQQMPEGARRPL